VSRVRFRDQLPVLVTPSARVRAVRRSQGAPQLPSIPRRIERLRLCDTNLRLRCQVD
jgi:hypothetical protein